MRPHRGSFASWDSLEVHGATGLQMAAWHSESAINGIACESTTWLDCFVHPDMASVRAKMCKHDIPYGWAINFIVATSNCNLHVSMKFEDSNYKYQSFL